MSSSMLRFLSATQVVSLRCAALWIRPNEVPRSKNHHVFIEQSSIEG